MATPIPYTPFRIPDILLPKKEIDLYKWSVIACDQFTSVPSYWKEVSSLVGDSPSMLNLILPELYLEYPDLDQRYASIQKHSQQYFQKDIFDHHDDTMLLVQRSSPRVDDRTGIIVQIDLSQYDTDVSKDLPIKATEGIISSRLPRRIEMRKNSMFDTSHVLMVYEDPHDRLLTELQECIVQEAYNTDLMMEGGSIRAFFCEKDKSCDVLSRFFREKSQVHQAILASGDGNHSLMSAKQTWIDNGADPHSNDRWALVEMVNIYSKGLHLEPIHRILFDADIPSFLENLREIGILDENNPGEYSTEIVLQDQSLYWVPHDKDEIPVIALEKTIQKEPVLYRNIDFIHSPEEVKTLVHAHTHSLGILFPQFSVAHIFEAVYGKYLFPRKSFSLGEDRDKKYYLETTLRV